MVRFIWIGKTDTPRLDWGKKLKTPLTVKKLPIAFLLAIGRRFLIITVF